MFKLFRRNKRAEEQRAELLKRVHEATKNAQCVVLVDTKEGTRLVLIGKDRTDKLTCQLEELAELKEVRL